MARIEWAAAIERAQAAWPGFRVEAEHFEPYLSERVRAPDDGDWEKAVAAVHCVDLYLACACVAGNPAALSELETRLKRESAIALKRFDASPTRIEDVQQQLRERLLIKPAGRPIRLAAYQGRGPLKTWLRSAATRLAINAHARGGPEVPVDDELWQRWPAGEVTAELKVLRTTFNAQFKSAFEGAFAQLDAEERNLLRLHLLDGLSIDQLALSAAVHRTTVARRIWRIKEGLVAHTRRSLAQTLRSTGTEIDELVQQVQSQLDVSIRRYLQEEGA